MFVTFYSYKGGVGRSMALANVADILARRGLAVLMVDFDLEAPGLEQYFQINQASARRNEGLLDLLVGYKRSMSVASTEDGETAEFRRVASFIVPVYEKLPGGGRLDLMPAGRREGPGQLEEYAFKLRTFDWQDFYFNWEGELFFEWLRGALVPSADGSGAATDGYDLVLVDSRTGVTEMGGICAYQLADSIVMLCAANHQNVQGTVNVAADFQSPRVVALRHNRPLSLVVVPARVEQRDPELLEQFMRRFEKEFGGAFPHSLLERGLGFRELTIPYEPQYAFEERVLSIPGRSDTRGTIAKAFHRLADAITLLASPDTRASAIAPRPDATKASAPAPAPALYDATTRFSGYDVYLACAPADRGQADEVARWLKVRGMSVFLDAPTTAISEDWRARTETALVHSRVCLVAIGADASLLGHRPLLDAITAVSSTRDLPAGVLLMRGASAGIQNEIREQRATGRWPAWLLDTWWFDVRSSPEPLEKVVETVRMRAEKTASGTPLSSLALSVVADPAPPPASMDDTRPTGGTPGEAGGSADRPTLITPSAPAMEVDRGAPYPGPRPFAERDATFFHGREQLVQTLLPLDGTTRVVVTGASAHGKTSLVLAGLLPAWRAAVVAKGVTLDLQICDAAASTPDDLGKAIDVVTAPARGGQAVLFVDHVERWLRDKATREAATAALSRLRSIAVMPAGPALVVATRDESQIEIVSGRMPSPELATGVSDTAMSGAWRVVRLTDLAPAAIREAVERPAEQAGLAFEPGVVDRLLADMASPPVNLTALQVVLAGLWERRREGWLTNGAYDAMQGVLAAQTAAGADAVMQKLTEDDRDTARRALLALVSVDDHDQVQARRARLSECEVPGVPVDRVRQVLGALVDAGVLVGGTDRRELYAEPTRELLRFWPQLAAWVDQDREFLKWRTRLRGYKADWERGGRDSGALLSGSLLRDALSQLHTRETDLTVEERDYIDSSERNARFVRLAQRVAVVILLVGLGYAAWGQFQIRQQEQAAQAAQAQAEHEKQAAALAGQAQLALTRQDVPAAVDALSKALELTPASQALRLRRGRAYDQAGRYDLALADLDAVIAADPKSAAAWYARGVTRFHMKRFDEALKDLDTSLAIDASGVDAHFNRAVVLDALGRPDDALAAYSKAISLNPQFADARFNRGVLRQDRGERSGAIEDFEALLKMDVDPQTKVAASARLRQLGLATATLPPASRPAEMFVHFADPGDAAVMDEIATVLRKEGYSVPKPQQLEVRSRGDVRYFFREDEKTAIQLQQAIEAALARQGYNLRLEVRYVNAKGLEGARQNRLEAWLPSLRQRLAVAQ